ncbi:MAG: flagellar export chaperone FliS [Methylophilus sp.]|nr:flagellar export chaperone FliS [Methylophilus sp.]MDP3607873.1 flagellar export chaperone FliS [Methylophilus sp.]
MFGFKSNGANVYAQMGLETGVVAASPNKLVVMLYEGAISACRNAITFMQQQDIQRKGEMISKAILIIESGLRLSLDKKAGGDIAQSLDALYAYMTQRLTVANIHNEVSAIEEVVGLLSEIKSAWEAIEHQPSPVDVAKVMAIKPQAAASANYNRMALGV